MCDIVKYLCTCFEKILHAMKNQRFFCWGGRRNERVGRKAVYLPPGFFINRRIKFQINGRIINKYPIFTIFWRSSFSLHVFPTAHFSSAVFVSLPNFLTAHFRSPDFFPSPILRDDLILLHFNFSPLREGWHPTVIPFAHVWR